MPQKNFAISTVATAPVTPTAGTSLVVAAGEGVRFPATPFKATIWPAGALPTPANAEVVTVTAVSTDTMTIVRAQESSTAQSVAVGYQFMASLTAAMYDTPTFSGIVTSTNTTDSTTAATGAIVTAGGIGIGKNLFVGAQAVLGNTSNDYAPLVLMRGLTMGMRYRTTSVGSIIEGVDNTGSGSYQPMYVGGSVLNIIISNTTMAVFTASNLSVTGSLNTTDTIKLTKNAGTIWIAAATGRPTVLVQTTATSTGNGDTPLLELNRSTNALASGAIVGELRFDGLNTASGYTVYGMIEVLTTGIATATGSPSRMDFILGDGTTNGTAFSISPLSATFAGNLTVTNAITNASGNLILNPANGIISISNAGAFLPQLNLFSSNPGATSQYIIFSRNRSGGSVNAGDPVGTVLFQAMDSGSAYRNAVDITAVAIAVGSGFVRGQFAVSVMNGAGVPTGVIACDSSNSIINSGTNVVLQVNGSQILLATSTGVGITGQLTTTGIVSFGGAVNSTYGVFNQTSLAGNNGIGLVNFPNQTYNANSQTFTGAYFYANMATGTLTGLVYNAVRIGTPAKSGTGTFNSSVQLYIDSGLAATSAYGIYQQGTEINRFGGPIQLDNTYVAGVVVPTGTITFKDATGQTYRVPCLI